MTRPPRPPAGKRPGARPAKRPGQGELPLDDVGPAETPPRAAKPARAGGKGAAAAKPVTKQMPVAERSPVVGKSPAASKSPAGQPAKPAGKPKRARVAKAAAPPPAGKPSAPHPGPVGFGGWLWLLVIGQLLVTARMIDTLMKMAATIGTPIWQDHPGLVIADLGLYGLALALQLAVLAALALRKRLFVPLFIASIIAYFLIGRIEPLLAIAFLDMDPAGLMARPVVTSMLIELAIGLVWGAYVLRSRRVRNTFVR